MQLHLQSIDWNSVNDLASWVFERLLGVQVDFITLEGNASANPFLPVLLNLVVFFFDHLMDLTHEPWLLDHWMMRQSPVILFKMLGVLFRGCPSVTHRWQGTARVSVCIGSFFCNVKIRCLLEGQESWNCRSRHGLLLGLRKRLFYKYSQWLGIRWWRLCISGHKLRRHVLHSDSLLLSPLPFSFV